MHGLYIKHCVILHVRVCVSSGAPFFTPSPPLPIHTCIHACVIVWLVHIKGPGLFFSPADAIDISLTDLQPHIHAPIISRAFVAVDKTIRCCITSTKKHAMLVTVFIRNSIQPYTGHGARLDVSLADRGKLYTLTIYN